jgi:hypothetical protein
MNAVKNVYQNTAKVTWLNTRYGYTFSTTTLFMDDTHDTSDVTTVTREASYIGALVFWLGGFPNQDGKFAGFSTDPEAPFGKETTPGALPIIIPNNGDYDYVWDPDKIEIGTQDKDSVFYEMIIGKNIEYVTTDKSIVFPVLVNRDATANKDGTTHVPYVYFKSTGSNGGRMAYLYLIDNTSTPSDPDFVSSTQAIFKPKCYEFNTVFSGAWLHLGLISPYAQVGDPSVNEPSIVWQEPERFQLIHPGLDGVFGNTGTTRAAVKLETTAYPKLIPNYFRSIDTNLSTNDISQKDFDNITNFSDYQQVKSILP